MSVKLAVIIGSTRSGRIGPKVAEWFAAIAATQFDVDLIDLAEFGFPRALGAGHPRAGHIDPELAPYAERIGSADAFVLVTPEYNHGYPASLKSALDALYSEWLAKPVGFVSYGGPSGGIRAVEQLRTVIAELHMIDVREAVAIPRIFEVFDAPDRLVAPTASATAMLAQLAWWSEVLKRVDTPYPG